MAGTMPASDAKSVFHTAKHVAHRGAVTIGATKSGLI